MNELLKYMGEFDLYCARVAAGDELQDITDESVRESVLVLCGLNNSARMAFATIMNNWVAREMQPGSFRDKL